MTTSFRGPLAFWAGGAAALAAATGVRGMLGFWMGGAGHPVTAQATQTGMRGMLAHWMGGAGIASPATSTGAGGSSGGGSPGKLTGKKKRRVSFGGKLSPFSGTSVDGPQYFRKATPDEVKLAAGRASALDTIAHAQELAAEAVRSYAMTQQLLRSREIARIAKELAAEAKTQADAEPTAAQLRRRRLLAALLLLDK